MMHAGRPDASLTTASRCIRRRSTTRPEPSSPTTLQLFLPRSIPRTAISMSASFPLAPDSLRCQLGGAGHPIKLSAVFRKTLGGLPQRRGRMIRLEDRQTLAAVVAEARADGARLGPACA